MSLLSFEDRPVVTSVVVILVAALFVGLIGWLTGNWLAATISVLAVLLVALVVVMVRSVFRREREDKLGRGVESRKDQAQSREERLDSGSRSDIQSKFDAAVSELRRTLGGRGAVYELPWYLVFGPDNAGKSTMLLESGLDLPAQYAHARVFGSTDGFEFLMFNEAVAIDTAGRLFTSNAERDRKQWNELLSRMKSSRPDCPANGLIFTIPVEHLLSTSIEKLEAEGQELRRRLNEIQVNLGLDAPIYVVITKADQLEGFVDLASSLPADRIDEAFGWTNDQRRVADPEARVFEAFEGIRERLDTIVHPFLMQATDPAARRRLFAFPQEVEALGEAVAAYVGSAFKRDIYNATPFLRGIYLTSSRFQGTTRSDTARRLGHEGWARTDHGTGTPRGYFLRELFREIVILDDELAVLDNQVAPASQRAMLIGGGVIAACMLALWSVSFWQNYQGTHALEAAAEPVLSADPTLEQIDTLRHTIEDLERGSFINTIGFGMLARAVDDAKVSFVHAFDRNYARATRDSLSRALRRGDDDAFRAAVALGTDLEWLSNSDAWDEGPPDFIPYMPKRARDGEQFLAAYSAYTRWLSNKLRADLLADQRDLLARDADRLLNLGNLETQTRRTSGKFSPVNFAGLGFGKPDPELTEVPGIYTRNGFEGLFGYLISAVEATGSIESRELATLYRNYAERHERTWRKLLLDTPTTPAPLREPKKSPHLALLEAIHENTSFEMERTGNVPEWFDAVAEIRRTEPTVEELAATEDEEGKEAPPPPWERYITALESVTVDVEAATEDPAAALAVAKTVAAGQPSTFSDAMAVARAIVPRLGDTVTRNRLRDLLEAPILDGFSQVLLSARDEIDVQWRERIASKYGGPVSQSQVEALYAPQAGELDVFSKEMLESFYRNGVFVKVLGDRRMPLGKAAVGWLRDANRLQRSLFPGGGGIPQVSVRVSGIPSTVEGVTSLRVTRRDLRLLCPDGDQTFIYREGSGAFTFNWGSRCQEVSLRITLGGAGQADQQLRREWVGPLAMPQFLRDGRRIGNDRLQWKFKTSDGADVLVKYKLVSGRDVRNIAHRKPPASLGS